MSVVAYRPARPEDLPESVQVYFAARDQMLVRNNIPVHSEPAETAVRKFRHVLETGIFEVAEAGGGLAAICHAVVRDGLWFLSGFWVRPEMQGQGIGGPLLRRVWEAGERQGARVFFVWSSVDRTAMAAYMRLGMLPGSQILKFSGQPGPGSALMMPEVSAGYETRPLTAADAAAIDRLIRGAGREVDHQYWAGDTSHHGALVLHHGKPAGYYYVLDSGDVAPAAWLEPADGASVLTLACREGLARTGTTGLKCTGDNHQAIGYALENGMRLDGFSHFLTSARFGKLDQYVVSGPLLF